MRLRRLLLPGAIALVGACSSSAPPPTSPRTSGGHGGGGSSGRAPELPDDDARFGRFHSKRFQLSVPLPDGRAWKIDDHTRPELVATHPPTTSRLAIQATHEEELMNRHRCEERARARGWVPAGHLTTVEDDVTIGPEAFDSRVWVALDAGRPGGGIEGHVFLFGAFIRRCLFVHVSTSVPSATDEGVLASRLALARARIVKGIALDAPRTTDDATVPRDRPEIRR